MPDNTYIDAMSKLATDNDFTVTSTRGGLHNLNSKHYLGLAIDVRTRDKTTAVVDAFIILVRSKGYRVIDERVQPKGQKVWNGPHIHIEVTDPKVIAEKKKELKFS